MLVSSELPDHPVENAFDGQRGPGGSRWVSETGGEQTLKLAFDAPQTIRAVGLEIEETEETRTQELQLAVSVRRRKNLSRTGASGIQLLAGRIHL